MEAEIRDTKRATEQGSRLDRYNSSGKGIEAQIYKKKIQTIKSKYKIEE